MKTLPLAKDLKLPADEAVAQKYAFIGRSGSGKTYGAMKLAELFLEAEAQVIVLDWVGNWWALRLAQDGKSPGFQDVYIFGGEHADAPLEATGRRFVHRVLRAFMGELRVILKRHAAEYYRLFPEARRPCNTCAFNPKTDRMRGFASTANGLMKSLRADTVFYCHEGIPWKKPVGEWTPDEIKGFAAKAKPCAGFACIVVSDPQASREAFVRAALGVNGKKPCQQAVDEAMAALKGFEDGA